MVSLGIGLLKLNTDACVNKEADWYSIGGVLRDHQGRLLLAFGNRISQHISVVHGELLAVLEGVKLLYEKNFNNVLVETDFLLAVQAVAATQDDLNYVCLCATDIGERFRNLAISYFTHVYRSANVVAHHLARLFLTPVIICLHEWRVFFLVSSACNG
ncbi:uncharacterized protein [Primulina eburnea]|uniref:uncharacterized protein n=1 Tax=Primulina eburnea TaxID=1245227 RepID=UPI003C6BF72C